MNILVIGNGGREHTIAWKLSQSRKSDKIFISPGNEGMGIDKKLIPIFIKENDFEKLKSLCITEKIEFIITGSETPLANGIVDYFQNEGFLIFGPTRNAAMLESSKSYAKELMKEVGIPTAEFQVFSDYNLAKNYILKHSNSSGLVVKADELAFGKGVFVCKEGNIGKEQAISALNTLLLTSDCGIKSKKIIIEERLKGREISYFVLCNGEDFIPIGSAKDYKRIFDGDLGPNTGGMGAFSPVPWVTSELENTIIQKIIRPTLQTMKKRGTPFTGVLFLGLMISPEGIPNLLEYNVRFGDPETQALLPLLDVDLLELLITCVRSELYKFKQSKLIIKNQTAIHVVLAAHGYPGIQNVPIQKGDEIFIQEDLLNRSNTNELLFFGGVCKNKHGHFETNGGRILGLTSLETNLETAKKEVYKNIQKIHFEGSQLRKDIGNI